MGIDAHHNEIKLLPIVDVLGSPSYWLGRFRGKVPCYLSSNNYSVKTTAPPSLSQFRFMLPTGNDAVWLTRKTDSMRIKMKLKEKCLITTLIYSFEYATPRLTDR